MLLRVESFGRIPFCIHQKVLIGAVIEKGAGWNDTCKSAHIERSEQWKGHFNDRDMLADAILDFVTYNGGITQQQALNMPVRLIEARAVSMVALIYSFTHPLDIIPGGIDTETNSMIGDAFWRGDQTCPSKG